MKKVVGPTKGTIVINRDNLDNRIGDGIEQTFNKMGTYIGEDRQETGHAFSRLLPMPNGELAYANLKVYT